MKGKCNMDDNVSLKNNWGYNGGILIFLKGKGIL